MENRVGTPHPRRTSLNFRQRSHARLREEKSLTATHYHDYQCLLVHTPRSFNMYIANLQNVPSIDSSVVVLDERGSSVIILPQVSPSENTPELGFLLAFHFSLSVHLAPCLYPGNDQTFKLSRFCGAFTFLKCCVCFQLSARSNTCFGDSRRHNDFTSLSYCDCQ